MQTAFDPKTDRWTHKTTDRLPRHDLYFGSPVNDPGAGLALGDGDIGTLLWLEKDGLHLHLNKCDLWSDAPEGVTENDAIFCSGREEALTSLRHGGEITLKFDVPLFDYLYQESFEARLSLTDACARIQNETPFGSLCAEAFAEAGSHVSVLRCAFTAAEPCAPVLRLFRFGSRNLWRWYAQQRPAIAVGLDGTDACAEDGMLFLTQVGDPVSFCLGLLFKGESCRTETVNGHVAALTPDPKTAHRFTVYYTIACGSDPAEAKALCAARLAAAGKEGADALYARHKAAWAEFWNRSYVSWPDDYTENIFYFYLYVMNSQSRGAYPPHFTRGLWGVYHDFLPWNYYFHYNMQHMYLPLDAAGHGELAENYYAMRLRGLAPAKRLAREMGCPGSFYHDVTDRYGRAAEYDSDNRTPGAQIAMQMYRHWRFTGDETFLEQTALPLMRETALFYLGLLKKDEMGVYHIYGTTAYEGNRPTDDTLTDLTMVRALFSALLPFAGDELAELLQDVLSALPDPIRVPLSEEDWNGEVLTRGIGKGQRPFGDLTVFAAGLRNGEPARIMKKEPEYGFPDIELCPLYPAGIFGLKDRGSPLFDTMRNQILIGGRVDMEWSMYPVYLARMGMAKELREMQKTMLERFQHFPNGFNAETGNFPCKDAPRWYHVKNTDTGAVSKVDSAPFTHFDFETIPIVAQSVVEALLQSHEGVIRLFPALEETESASFSLFAEGGIGVSAQCGPEGFLAVFDVCGDAGFCAVLPERFDSGALFLYRRTGSGYVECALRRTQKGNETALDLRDALHGARYLLISVPLTSLLVSSLAPALPNDNMKECGQVCLGSPRLLSFNAKQ